MLGEKRNPGQGIRHGPNRTKLDCGGEAYELWGGGAIFWGGKALSAARRSFSPQGKVSRGRSFFLDRPH